MATRRLRIKTHKHNILHAFDKTFIAISHNSLSCKGCWLYDNGNKDNKEIDSVCAVVRGEENPLYEARCCTWDRFDGSEVLLKLVE